MTHEDGDVLVVSSRRPPSQSNLISTLPICHKRNVAENIYTLAYLIQNFPRNLKTAN